MTAMTTGPRSQRRRRPLVASMRATAAEISRLDALAKRYGMSRAAYVRWCVMRAAFCPFCNGEGEIRNVSTGSFAVGVGFGPLPREVVYVQNCCAVPGTAAMR